MLKTDGETLLSKTLYDATIPGENSNSNSCQMIISYRIVAMLKKFRSLTGAPMMSTLGEESEEPSSPTKVNVFQGALIHALLQQTPTVTVNGSSGDPQLVKVSSSAKVFHPHLGKPQVTDIHSHLPEFEKV